MKHLSKLILAILLSLSPVILGARPHRVSLEKLGRRYTPWKAVHDYTSTEKEDKYIYCIETIKDGSKKLVFQAPSESGAYRLYIHVYDDVNHKAAYAGIPFLVKGDARERGDLGGRP